MYIHRYLQAPGDSAFLFIFYFFNSFFPIYKPLETAHFDGNNAIIIRWWVYIDTHMYIFSSFISMGPYISRYTHTCACIRIYVCPQVYTYVYMYTYLCMSTGVGPLLQRPQYLHIHVNNTNIYIFTLSRYGKRKLV